MRIVFMGTPEFAVASLNALIDAGCNIVGVVTAPDRPAGRGQKLQESAVKKYAVEHGLKVLQPEKLRDQSFIDQLKSLNADLQVVVAFRMLPEMVWNMPKKGTINLHASLLPQYRGAAPINWVLLNGEKETGVTTFFLKQDIDTGNILFTEKVTLNDSYTAGLLHDKLMEKGAGLLVKTVKAVESGKYNETVQQTIINDSDLKHAPKLFNEDRKINWDQTTDQIFNQIRGLSPYPAAFTELNGKVLKIFGALKEQGDIGADLPGTTKTDNKSFLKFAAKDGYLSITDLQLEGKKRMRVSEYLCGMKIL